MAARAGRSDAAEEDARELYLSQIRDEAKDRDQPRTEIIDYVLGGSTDVPMHPNLKHALKRIGKKAEERARWLLDFAAQDMAAVSQGRRLDLAWEIVCFVTVPRMRVIRLETDRSGGIIVPIEEIHQWVRDGIIALSKGVEVRQDGPFDVEMASSWRIDAQLSSRLSWDGQRLVDDSAKLFDIKGRFAAEVHRVLLAAGSRFRLCPKCRAPFIARGRQNFCSPRCSQAVRTQRYRANNREKVREARQQKSKRSRVKGHPQQRARLMQRPSKRQ